MFHFKLSALALSVGLLMGVISATPVFADVTYDYIGFDLLEAYSPWPGAEIWTDPINISLTFTNGGRLSSWSIGGITSTDPTRLGGNVDFNTDSFGLVNSWNISAWTGSQYVTSSLSGDLEWLHGPGQWILASGPTDGNWWSTNGSLANLNVQLQLSPGPEPETYTMLLAGLGLIGFIAYRRKDDSSDMLMTV